MNKQLKINKQTHINGIQIYSQSSLKRKTSVQYISVTYITSVIQIHLHYIQMLFFMIFKIVSGKKLFIATIALMLFFSVENHMHLQTTFCAKSFATIGTYGADKQLFIAVCELVSAQVASLSEPPSTNLFARLSFRKHY